MMASTSNAQDDFVMDDDDVKNVFAMRPMTSASMTTEKFANEKRAADIKEFEKSVLSAIKFDIDTLATRFCSDPENLTLARFGQLFDDMELSTIFYGRFSNSDLVEFSENLFHYAASYMFGPLSNRLLPDYIESRVNPTKMTKMFPVSPEQLQRTHMQRIYGIFVTYSLYFMQPSQFVIPIPVTVLQLDELHEYIDTVLLPDENFEPLYCLYRLISANAFNIHPFEGNFNPFLHRHFDLFDADPAEFELKQLENLDDFGTLQQIANDPLLKQAEAMHNRYMEAKRQNSSALPQNALAAKEGPQQLISRLLVEAETAFRKRKTQGMATTPSSSTTDDTDLGRSVLNRRRKK